MQTHLYSRHPILIFAGACLTRRQHRQARRAGLRFAGFPEKTALAHHTNRHKRHLQAEPAVLGTAGHGKAPPQSALAKHKVHLQSRKSAKSPESRDPLVREVKDARRMRSTPQSTASLYAAIRMVAERHGLTFASLLERVLTPVQTPEL